jgi:hypothetical protein
MTSHAIVQFPKHFLEKRSLTRQQKGALPARPDLSLDVSERA